MNGETSTPRGLMRCCYRNGVLASGPRVETLLGPGMGVRWSPGFCGSSRARPERQPAQWAAL